MINKEKLKEWNIILTSIASIFAIGTFIVSFFIIKSYLLPYVVSSEVIKEYSPEDYLTVSSLTTPNYILKTTENIIIKPSSLPYKICNDKKFYLPSDSFNIKVDPNSHYSSTIDEKDKSITFHFLRSRSSTENIQISYSYKQEKNPSIILLDYSGIVESNTIEDNLILENTENAKITLFRATWLVNIDEKDWNISNIQMNSKSISFDGTIIIPRVNKTILNNTDVLIYSWDMNFKENEIKPVKIITETNLNYSNYSIMSEYLRIEPALEIQFPYNEDNFDWIRSFLIFPNCTNKNKPVYVNGSCILMFPFPYILNRIYFL